MFWGVSLSTHDCNLELWKAKSLKDVILGLSSISPQVQDDLNNAVMVISNYAIWNTYTYDPIVEEFIKTIRRNGISDNVGVTIISTLDKLQINLFKEFIPNSLLLLVQFESRYTIYCFANISHGTNMSTNHRRGTCSINTLGNQKFSAYKKFGIKGF